MTTMSLIQKSHANMSTIFETQGHKEVVAAMVSGDAGFCYVDVHPDNPFKFGITGVPKTIMENKFSTLSKHGVLRRMKDGDVEHVALDRFVREHDLYSRLLELTVFKKYKLWKSFLLWNRHIKMTKFARIVSFLYSFLSLICIFYAVFYWYNFSNLSWCRSWFSWTLI
jgi:hypothetical protein